MTMQPLTQEQIDELLQLHRPTRTGAPQRDYAPPEQKGPVRFKLDRGTRPCLHMYKDGPCGAPSVHEFRRTPHCILHILIACNELLVEMGVME